MGFGFLRTTQAPGKTLVTREIRVPTLLPETVLSIQNSVCTRSSLSPEEKLTTLESAFDFHLSRFLGCHNTTMIDDTTGNVLPISDFLYRYAHGLKDAPNEHHPLIAQYVTPKRKQLLQADFGKNAYHVLAESTANTWEAYLQVLTERTTVDTKLFPHKLTAQYVCGILSLFSYICTVPKNGGPGTSREDKQYITAESLFHQILNERSHQRLAEKQAREKRDSWKFANFGLAGTAVQRRIGRVASAVIKSINPGSGV